MKNEKESKISKLATLSPVIATSGAGITWIAAQFPYPANIGIVSVGGAIVGGVLSVEEILKLHAAGKINIPKDELKKFKMSIKKTEHWIGKEARKLKEVV